MDRKDSTTERGRPSLLGCTLPFFVFGRHPGVFGLPVSTCKGNGTAIYDKSSAAVIIPRSHHSPSDHELAMQGHACDKRRHYVSCLTTCLSLFQHLVCTHMANLLPLVKSWLPGVLRAPCIPIGMTLENKSAWLNTNTSADFFQSARNDSSCYSYMNPSSQLNVGHALKSFHPGHSSCLTCMTPS